MSPNFFIVGAPKAATTSLHNYLTAYQDIYLSMRKGVKFFARVDCYEKGIRCTGIGFPRRGVTPELWRDRQIAVYLNV